MVEMDTREISVVGRNARRLRKGLGLTQEQLAARSGIGVSTIRDLERGATSSPDLDTIEGLAAALGVPPGALLEDAIAAAEWLAAFDASPHAATLDPPLSKAEREWLLSLPAALWSHLAPEPRTLVVVIEERRRQLAARK